MRRLAIANRGEVAVRILRACEELGIESVLLHSEPDRQSKAFRESTYQVCIGPAASRDSYLNIQANIKAALSAGADAIHPGFGFLSENAEFAEACQKAGLIFVGPKPESIRRLGDKVSCKQLAAQLKIPLVPGYSGDQQDTSYLIKEAERIGYPVMVKAAAGGGGRGMKILRNSAEAAALIDSAKREALSAFSSEKIFLEKYLDHAKHIEFQIFGDHQGQVIHLWDRECSVQRRHQKIIEEATSPSLSKEMREEMATKAVQIAQACQYQSAGTVEFLLQDGKYYLLEVNTRLQVEHPVTELVLGIDLVKAQIRTAQGEAVDFGSRHETHGHAIECRVYAEDPFQNGVPSTGKLGLVRWPEGPGRRFECGFERGDEITPHYDPMIAKVIVWDETRPAAIRKMIQVLRGSIIFGVQTNIPYLIEILSHPEFQNGQMHTRFIEQYFSEGLTAPKSGPIETEALRLARQKCQGQRGQTASPFLRSWWGP